MTKSTISNSDTKRSKLKINYPKEITKCPRLDSKSLRSGSNVEPSCAELNSL